MLIWRQIISTRRCLAWIRESAQVVQPDEVRKGLLSGSGEMADALGLGPSGEIRGGSSPFSRTNSPHLLSTASSGLATSSYPVPPQVKPESSPLQSQLMTS